MKLIKNTYIHNHLFFDEVEHDILISASKIVSAIRNENIHSSGAEDVYLTENVILSLWVSPNCWITILTNIQRNN